MEDHTKQGQAGFASADVAWREARLRVAGFDWESASGLARDDRVDLHALLELVDCGCPPRLAARILAPLDGVRR